MKCKQKQEIHMNRLAFFQNLLSQKEENNVICTKLHPT